MCSEPNSGGGAVLLSVGGKRIVITPMGMACHLCHTPVSCMQSRDPGSEHKAISMKIPGQEPWGLF